MRWSKTLCLKYPQMKLGLLQALFVPSGQGPLCSKTLGPTPSLVGGAAMWSHLGGLCWGCHVLALHVQDHSTSQTGIYISHAVPQIRSSLRYCGLSDSSNFMCSSLLAQPLGWPLSASRGMMSLGGRANAALLTLRLSGVTWETES